MCVLVGGGGGGGGCTGSQFWCYTFLTEKAEGAVGWVAVCMCVFGGWGGQWRMHEERRE